jgi:hypothetical protein
MAVATLALNPLSLLTTVRLMEGPSRMALS